MQNLGRLIVTIAGTKITEAEKKMLAHPIVAGIIFFPENYTIPSDYADKPQLRDLIQEIKSVCDKPCFVDQEGGYVQRFGRGFECLPPAKVFAKTYDLNPDVAKKIAYEYGYIMAKELLEFDIISLAPVCDLDAGNTVITRLGRGFHSKPDACLELVTEYINGMNAAGMQATGKHFPGHGQDNGDSHLNLVADDRTLTEIENNDLHIFIELIKANKLAAIMPAHIVYSKVDSDNTVGSSDIWLNEILRKKYGFKGLIISDCLTMVGAGSESILDKVKYSLKYCDVATLCHQDPIDIMKLGDILLEQDMLLNDDAQQRFNIWTGKEESVDNVQLEFQS